MANTEGMTDEVMSSLFSTQPQSHESNKKGNSKDNNKKPISSFRASLQQRMESDPSTFSDGPAAKVIRKRSPALVKSSSSSSSSTQKKKTTKKVTLPQDDKDVNQEEILSPPQQVPSSRRPAPPIVLGSIVERPISSTPLAFQRGRTSQTVSKFKSSRSTANPTPQGYPSMQDRPLGTFVKNRHSQKSMKSHFARAQTNIVATTPQDSKSTTTTTTHHPSENNNHTPKSMIEQEAHSMLAQMSLDEIRQEQDELQSALSPDTIAFLKKRHAQKQQQQKSNKTTPPNESTTTPTTTHTTTQTTTRSKYPSTQSSQHTDNNNNNNNNNNKDNETQQEKEEMAKLLSSIQTEEDLDVAFASMKGIDLPTTTTTLHHLQDEEGNSTSSSSSSLNEFEHACNLLRSTVPRQVLWAVKIINSTLQQDLEMELQRRRRRGNASSTQKRTYPPLLPVALRCLLDEDSVPTTTTGDTTSRSGRSTETSHTMIVHAHVLQALYTLVRLTIHPDHDVNVTTPQTNTATVSSSKDNLYEDSTKMMMTDRQIYQDYSLDDTCMTPPLELCYPPVTTVGEDADTEEHRRESKNREGRTAAAYATLSSSTSANVDAKAFWKDPLWTLLSKMKIIPRLVQLVSYKVYILEESVSAICGIVTLLSCRSPGAATAIVQHETLLPCLLPQTTLLPPYFTHHDDDDDTEERDETSLTTAKINGTSTQEVMYAQPKVALPALIMLCTLAQQSRIVATSLMKWINIIVPPILALGEESPSLSDTEQQHQQEFFQLQKQALVLWRIVLRYGLGIQHGTTTFATLGISHISKTISTTAAISTESNDYISKAASSSSLAPEYLSSFAIFCDCIKHILLDAGSSSDTSPYQEEEKQPRRLEEEESYSWMLSFVNQCTRTFSVELIDNNSTTDHQDYNITNNTDSGTPTKAVSPNVNQIKLYASRLRLMTAFMTMITATSLQQPEPDQHLLQQRLLSEYIQTLKKIFYQSKTIQWAVEKYFSKFAFVVDWDELEQEQKDQEVPVVQNDNHKNTGESSLLSLSLLSLDEEVAACTILEQFATLLGVVSAGFSAISSDDKCNANYDNSAHQKIDALQNDFLKLLMDCCFHKKTTTVTKKSPLVETRKLQNNDKCSYVSRARKSWINKCQFVISTFLARIYTSSPQNPSKEVLPFLQTMVFTLLGRLDKGEERMAVYFFQRPFIFQSSAPISLEPSTTTKVSEDDGEESSLCSMFLTELCRTPNSRAQLNHSSKLLRGVGMTGSSARSDVGLGTSPFGLQTLLSNADDPNPRPPTVSDGDSSGSVVQQQFLPLGKLWLWNVLSGTVVGENETAQGQQSNSEPTIDVCKILLSCLHLLIGLEIAGETVDTLYANRIPNGAKLYHLSNICLYPENIMRADEIRSRMISLFDTYTTSDSEGDCEYAFAKASADHSYTSRKNGPISNFESKEDDEKLFSLLGSESEAAGLISTKELLALQDFSGDLCNAYIEYGAQYDVFTKFVRFMLRPGFPPKIRCDVIHRLRNVLHLLSLPSEEENFRSLESDMAVLLENSLAVDRHCGDDGYDNLARDAPQVLNAVAGIFKQSQKEGTLSRWGSSVSGYFFLWSIALLARSLVSSIISDMSNSGTSSSQTTRLTNLPIEIFELVQRTAVLFLRTSPDRNRHNLVLATLKTCSDTFPPGKCLEFCNQVTDRQTLDNAMAMIKVSLK